jgi:hypothetical protein
LFCTFHKTYTGRNAHYKLESYFTGFNLKKYRGKKPFTSMFRAISSAAHKVDSATSLPYNNGEIMYVLIRVSLNKIRAPLANEGGEGVSN